MDDRTIKKLDDSAISDRLMQLRPIDDMFFRLLSERKEVCQEIIETLLMKECSTVTKASPQHTLIGMNRSAILDVLCEMMKEGLVNIEVQKDTRNDDLRRARFHASLITSIFTPKNVPFSGVPDVKVIYISEYDALGTGRPVAKILNQRHNSDGTVNEVANGEEIYFATSAVQDDSKASRLLQRMVDSTAFTDPEFPHLSEAVRYFKCTKEGNNNMCKLSQELKDMGREEGREEGRKEGKLELLVSLINDGLFTIEDVVKKYGFTEQQILQAMK